MKFQTEVQREMTSIAFCVTGLTFTVIGLFIIADKFNLSVLLSIFVGSAASILNRYLQVLTVQISAKHHQKKAYIITELLKVFRILFMCAMALIIFIVPILHDLLGILAMFFSQFSRIVISRIK